MLSAVLVLLRFCLLFSCICRRFIYFFFSSRRRHTRWNCDGVQTCALPIHFVNADDNSTPPSSSTQGSLRAGGAIRRKKQIPRVLPLRAGMAKLLREAKKPVLSSCGRA